MTPAEAQPPAPHPRANARFYLCAALLTYSWMPRGPREPEYNGRTLTQSLAGAVKNDDNPTIRLECEEAIRQIGTNGLPTLLKLCVLCVSVVKSVFS